MRRGLYILLFIGLIVGNILVYQAIFAPHVLKVTVLEVNKGDSTLVQTPSGKTILIDAGLDASILRALGTALPPWQRRIDIIILTGTKSSLVGGLPAVESRYHIGTHINIGDTTTPYGSLFNVDGISIKIISPGVLSTSYGSTVFSISSSTPKGTYISTQ